MINLTLIADISIKQTLADILRGMPQIERFIFTDVEEHSQQLEHEPLLSEHDKVVGYVPRVRVDIMLQEDAFERLRAALSEPECGLTGRCRYWVTPVQEINSL